MKLSEKLWDGKSKLVILEIVEISLKMEAYIETVYRLLRNLVIHGLFSSKVVL